MGDDWDDSDDDWDKSDDELDAKLNSVNQAANAAFEDEEDLAVKEKAEQDKAKQVALRTKGKALADKKAKEKERQEEEEIARKAMELEAEAEANMTSDERRKLERQRIEDADHALTDDLFGGGGAKGPAAGNTAGAGNALLLKDYKDHLKHARKVAEAMRKHKNVHFALAFFKECMQQAKDTLDDDAVGELIKSLNVIKNEKVQAAKKKVKGQAQKSKKADKAAAAKARQIQVDTFGDNDQYDEYDVYGEDYEDAFF